MGVSAVARPTLRTWWQWLRGNRLRILMYHSVADEPADPWAVTPPQFAAQLTYLAENQFRVISLAEACRLLATGANLRRTVVLTFDDGYRDFLLNALPLLREFNFPATLFVVTGRLGQTAMWRSVDKNRALLTEAEVRQVQAQGITLGSHTVTHVDLTTVPPAQLTEELTTSQAAVAAWGEAFSAFAYPGGRFTAREQQAVQQAGYTCAVIVGGRWGNGPETNRWLLRREPMLAQDTLAWFAHRVRGHYELHYLAARWRGQATR